MKKLLAGLALGGFLVPAALADGMAHYRRSPLETWSLLGEQEQSALIHYHKGREAMLLSVDLEQGIGGGSAVWIFPIPSGPEDVAIDIQKANAAFSGYDIARKVRSGLVEWPLGMAGFSTFPLSLPLIGTFIYRYRHDAYTLGPSAHGLSPLPSGVLIHRRISKMGLTTDLVTTKDPEALARYLSAKGLDLPKSSMDVLEWYVGKEYSFVVSFTDSSEPAKADDRSGADDEHGGSDGSTALSLFVSFPTEEIYFPLKPTSVYGKSPIPINLLIVGHVSPRLYPGISFHTRVSFLSGRLELDRSLEPFWLGRKAATPRYFTEISIGALSEDLTDDLWIKNSAPPWIRKWRVLADYLVVWFVCLYLGCSVLASLAAAKLSFKDPPMPFQRMLGHGLWNCLTMLAFIPATAWLRTKRGKITYFLLFYVFFLTMLAAGAGIPWLIIQ